MSNTCPHCGGKPPPAAAVVLGLVDPDTAPVLTYAWTAVRRCLTDQWQPRMPLVEAVADEAGCTPATVENLIRAAARAGIIEHTHRVAGDPPSRRRVRAYVRRRQATP